MQTKLTLTLEDEAIESAKYYAKKHHTSLSKMVQGFFVQTTGVQRKAEVRGVLRELSGILKDMDLSNPRELKRKRLERKYGLSLS